MFEVFPRFASLIRYIGSNLNSTLRGVDHEKDGCVFLFGSMCIPNSLGS